MYFEFTIDVLSQMHQASLMSHALDAHYLLFLLFFIACELYFYFSLQQLVALYFSIDSYTCH